MVRSLPAPSCLRLVLPVCLLALLQLLTTLHLCSGAETPKNAEDPLGEEMHRGYNTARYLNGDGGRDDSSRLLFPSLGAFAGVLVISMCFISEWKRFQRFKAAVESAKEQIETDIAENAHNSRNTPPSQATYNLCFIDAEDDDIGGYRISMTLTFSKINTNNGDSGVGGNWSSKNGSGWNITGGGMFYATPKTVSEGKLCDATGRAYWVETTPYGGQSLRVGKFETPNYGSFDGICNGNDRLLCTGHKVRKSTKSRKFPARERSIEVAEA